VSRLVGRGDITGMMEKMKDMGVMEKSPKLITNMVTGDFCFADFRSMLDMFKKAGPLSQVCLFKE
jgi:signal recognition particle GTPase